MICNQLAAQKGMKNTLQELVAAGQRDGSVSREFPPHTLSKFIINNLIGIRIYGKSCGSGESYQDIIEVVMSLLRNSSSD